jgi:hypothetical protein
MIDRAQKNRFIVALAEYLHIIEESDYYNSEIYKG